MGGLSFGPFALSADRLAAGATLVALMILTSLLARRSGERLNRWATHAVVAGVVAARAGFVAENLGVFAEAPWSALALWQGGFAWLYGALAVAAVTAGHLLRHPGDGLAAAVVLGGALITWGGVSEVVASKASPPLPVGGYAALDGHGVDLSDRDGRPLVVNLWASWCPPCRREMPMMMEVAAEVEGADVVFANQGEDMDVIRSFLESASLTEHEHGVVTDPFSTLLGHYGVVGLPATLFFSAEGHLEQVHLGEISRPLLLSHIADLEAVAPVPAMSSSKSTSRTLSTQRISEEGTHP